MRARSSSFQSPLRRLNGSKRRTYPTGCRCSTPRGMIASALGGIVRMSDDRVFAKCAWRLVPFMTLLLLVNYIDRLNVGFAALTMNKDLGFSPSVFGFGAGVF